MARLCSTATSEAAGANGESSCVRKTKNKKNKKNKKQKQKQRETNSNDGKGQVVVEVATTQKAMDAQHRGLRNEALHALMTAHVDDCSMVERGDCKKTQQCCLSLDGPWRRICTGGQERGVTHAASLLWSGVVPRFKCCFLPGAERTSTSDGERCRSSPHAPILNTRHLRYVMALATPSLTLCHPSIPCYPFRSANTTARLASRRSPDLRHKETTSAWLTTTTPAIPTVQAMNRRSGRLATQMRTVTRSVPSLLHSQP